MGNLKDYVTNTAGDLLSFGAKGLINYGLNSMAMDKQNEYNLPKNQMARFVDAGLSPAAAAQAILGNPSTSAAMTGQGGADQKMSYVEMKIAKKQLEMQERFNEAEIDVLSSQAEKNRAETSRTNQLTPYEIQQIQQNVKESASREKLNDKQTEQVKAMTDKILMLSWIEQQQALEALRGLRYDNDVKEVKSKLAKEYHINPDSEVGAQIVQLILSGDEKVVNTIVDSFSSVVNGGIENLKPKLNFNLMDYIGDNLGLIPPIVRHGIKNKQTSKGSKASMPNK